MNILWQKEKVHRRSLPAAAPPCGPRWAGPHKEKSEKERGRRDRRGERDGDGVVTLPYGFHANSATTSDKIRVKIVQVSKVTWFCKLRDGIQFYNPMTRWDWTLWPNIEGPPILGPKSKPNNRSASRDGEGVAGNRRRRGGWRRDTGAQQGHRRRLPYETRRRSGDWIAAELSPSLSPPAVGKQRAARRGGESLLRHRQRGQWDYLLAPLRDAATSPSASSPLRTVHWTWRLHLARDATRRGPPSSSLLLLNHQPRAKCGERAIEVEHLAGMKPRPTGFGAAAAAAAEVLVGGGCGGWAWRPRPRPATVASTAAMSVRGPGTTQAAAAASAVHSERHRGGVHGLQLPPLRLQFTADLEARIEKVIYACRFMTFLAIAGSLIGSVPCFLKVDFYLLSSGSIYS